MDLRVGLETVAAWLHNYDVRQQENHRQRVTAARRRLLRLRQLAKSPDIEENRRFAVLMSYVRRIEPLIFEEVVLGALQQSGYLIRENRSYSGDGGIDGRVWIEDWRKEDPWFSKRYPDRIVRGWAGIQVKRYEGAVHREHLRQFPHDLAEAGLVAGFFIHTGTTPRERKPEPRSAEDRLLPPVRRISGAALLQLLTIGEYSQNLPSGQPQVSDAD